MCGCNIRVSFACTTVHLVRQQIYLHLSKLASSSLWHRPCNDSLPKPMYCGRAFCCFPPWSRTVTQTSSSYTKASASRPFKEPSIKNLISMQIIRSKLGGCCAACKTTSPNYPSLFDDLHILFFFQYVQDHTRCSICPFMFSFVNYCANVEPPTEMSVLYVERMTGGPPHPHNNFFNFIGRICLSSTHTTIVFDLSCFIINHDRYIDNNIITICLLLSVKNYNYLSFVFFEKKLGTEQKKEEEANLTFSSR